MTLLWHAPRGEAQSQSVEQEPPPGTTLLIGFSIPCGLG